MSHGCNNASSRNTSHPESNENEFQSPVNSIPAPPLRTPLNTIPDPLQNPKDFQDNESSDFKTSTRPSHKKIESLSHATPNNRRGGGGKVQLEPKSGHSTPARSASSMVSIRGGGGCARVLKGGSVSVAPMEPSTEIPCFELVQDPSFWTDHNVQVLIRIRPVSSMERALQGNVRCLKQENAQTLSWLGHPETRFTFDHIACEMISQEKLFKVAGLPMVENCMLGYNSCMFAYGQTGSGKTYTMMGDIYELDEKLHEDCGMTPRIFEHLFTRIRAEEELKREENLRYSCKCSFLEIYNEQITDLLDTSSTNLQLREDLGKGVYVENLTEYEVTTVKDVVQLLLKGASNRKMAATNMNSESSRSHSVFTCIIQSRRDIDSVTHLRFGRLNLVDLAGSERQKSSGAEGERLKEAANINKSLSTLGLVIMSLVDVAHGKHRHVPYRDSRLTFLLQDSLGGNSKTTIIANISPSICSANETLSTLKFAQRAKLIQNNAKVNEDAPGDVMAMQQQIRQLKDQLTFLLKNQSLSKSPTICWTSFEQPQSGDLHETHDSTLEGKVSDHQKHISFPKEKMKSIKATLCGALRREKMADTSMKRLEAEIEHMNRLVNQREEDAQRTKMILRFREEKIKRLELLSDGIISADEYLMEENKVLSEEVQLLQAKIDRNPELTQFALENTRLIEHLRMFQDFYEQGEREALLAEVSELRDQLIEIVQGNYGKLNSPSGIASQTNGIIHELEDCKRKLDACLEINAKLTVEVEELRRVVNARTDCIRADIAADAASRDSEMIQQTDQHSSVEVETAKTIINLQEELAELQEELQEHMISMTEENSRLRNIIEAREDEINMLSEEWEKATLELTSFLVDGSRSLGDASVQIGSIASSFPERKAWICEHVERAANNFLEKERTIVKLQKSLEDAQRLGLEMNLKLSSLKGATLAITEIQQLEKDENSRDIILLQKLLSEKMATIVELEEKLRNEDQITEADKYASNAEGRSFEIHNHSGEHSKKGISELDVQAVSQLQCTNLRLVETETGCNNTREVTHSEFDDSIFVEEEKIKMASSFFSKFEEAQATVKEADDMLIALLQANENAKHVTDLWKQAGEDLMMERVGLVEEVQLLKSSLCLKEGEYESMQTQLHSGLADIEFSISSLEDSFLQVKKDVEESFKVVCSDILSLGQDLIGFISKTRSSLEDLWAEIMENDFALFVMYRCYTQNLCEKISCLNLDPDLFQYRQDSSYSAVKNASEGCTSVEGDYFVSDEGSKSIEEYQIENLQHKLCKLGDSLVLSPSTDMVLRSEEKRMGLNPVNLMSENLSLKSELLRKDVLLKGLLFDMSLLQESTSSSKDIKDATEQMFAVLTAVRHELAVKSAQLDEILLQDRNLEDQVADCEAALCISNSKVEQANETIEVLSKKNSDLTVALENLYAKKSAVEEKLEEQKEVIKSLEKEILRIVSSVEEKNLVSVEEIEDELRRVTAERDHLCEEVACLNDRLETAYALADENEAIAVEARQESEASKVYAEQKEEEAKILEHSVEELESTINVLETKVYDMGAEVERHHRMRDDLERELQALRLRMLTVENSSENMESGFSDFEQKNYRTSRHLIEKTMDLEELQKQIRALEQEREDQAIEIKECREYISELVLHAEAQATQYQQKYKTLEGMVREVLRDTPASTSIEPPQEKIERNLTRTRGSSSPFRCIAGLVQQMKLEKDQEMSEAMLKIKELEALASNRQKEVCMLNTRLAAAENMTHDVIRDLLGVKLDMTNYANLIDQHQVEHLLEEAQQQTKESTAKGQENLKLSNKITDLTEEIQSCFEEINRKEADILAAQVTLEQLKQRDQMLTAQNEMLKIDKINLKRKIAEMDEVLKKYHGPLQQHYQHPTKFKENNSVRSSSEELRRRLANSDKLISRSSDINDPHNRQEQWLKNKRQEPED